MHCLEDFQKYFFEIILTEIFSKINLSKISRYAVLYIYSHDNAKTLTKYSLRIYNCMLSTIVSHCNISLKLSYIVARVKIPNCDIALCVEVLLLW